MRASPESSDEELWRLLRAGDEYAFTLLYRRRQGGVYRFALQMSGSVALAEDVTQEVFMVLMREAEKFDPARGTLGAYLYGIARHQVLRRMERERSFVAMDDESKTCEKEEEADDPLDQLVRGELVESIRQAVLALPAHYREVVVLCELHEMSYAEAASVLQCAVGTVRSRLHRARALLCERLHAQRETEEASKLLGQKRCFA